VRGRSPDLPPGARCPARDARRAMPGARCPGDVAKFS